MKWKVIVSDMDDTLLTSKKEIDPITKQKLLEVQEQGIRLILASGRPKGRVMDYAKELQMDKYGGYIIESNGSAYYHFDSDTYTPIRKMNKQEMCEVFTFLHERFPDEEIMFMGEVNAYIFKAKGHSESQHFNARNEEACRNREIVYINGPEEIEEDVPKMAVYGTKEVIEAVASALKEWKSDVYWSGIVHYFWLELTPIEVSKGNALKQIMEKEHLSKEDVLAFGDGENDISMLSLVQGVAMGNAIATVKETCYYHTVSNNECGVAKFLEEHE